MIIRTFVESIQSLLQGMGYMNSLGICNFVNLILFLPYSYLLMKYLQNPLIAFSLAMAIYETLGLILSLYFYFWVIDKKYRNYELGILSQFRWYIWEAFKTVLTSYAGWFSFEAVLLIITMTHNKAQIAAYCLLANVPSQISFFILGA